MYQDGNPRTRGVLVRRMTGDSTPYEFPIKPVRLVQEWPPTAPPFQPDDFFRADQNDDGIFYTIPKLVYHIDEPAVAALTQFYRKNIKEGSDILDICSSWVSYVTGVHQTRKSNVHSVFFFFTILILSTPTVSGDTDITHWNFQTR